MILPRPSLIRRTALLVLCTLALLSAPRPVAAQEIDGGEVLTWALIGAGIGAVVGVVTLLVQSGKESPPAAEAGTESSRSVAAGTLPPPADELVSASANLDGISVRWLGRPRSNATALQMRFQRYARGAGSWGCGELVVDVDGQISRHIARYDTSSQRGVRLEVLDSEVGIGLVRAMQTAKRVDVHLCGVDRTLTVAATDAIRRFLVRFDAAAPAPPRPAASSAAIFRATVPRNADRRAFALGKRFASGVTVAW